MNKFTDIVKNKVISAIEEYSMFCNTDDVVVGFSGGADSVCLLHLLNSLKDELNVVIRAIHVNHGIRGDEAERDAVFSRDFCVKHNIPFILKEFDCIKISQQTKESLEECGRRVRYEFFNEVCNSYSKIATAHNANDNAETVIFNLSRGTSLKGVCGIPVVRGNVVRPLILCSRQEIEGYCFENGLEFITDSTNLSDDYTRNRIRHNILPFMEEVNSSAVSNITSFCKSAEESFDFIRTQAKNALDKAFICRDTYNVDVLKTLHIAVLNECIAIAFSCFSRKSLNRKKINDIVSLIYSTGRIQLFGEESVEVVKNQLRFYKNSVCKSPKPIFVDEYKKYEFGEYTINFQDLTENLNLNDKNVLDNLIDCDKIVGNLFLRTRCDGDKISLQKRNVTKSLKKLFNELGFPVEKRSSIPVLCDDEGIVWVYSVGVDTRCCPNESSCNILLVKGENNGWQ